MNILLIILLVLFDCLFYHYFHEVKRWKLGIVFWPVIYKGEVLYPIYRIIQGSLDILACWFLYPDWVSIVSMGMAWYLMTKEYLYYLFIFDLGGLEEMEQDGVRPKWLCRIWFSGYWLFKKRFTFERFAVSCLIGIAILILSNLYLIAKWNGII